MPTTIRELLTTHPIMSEVHVWISTPPGSRRIHVFKDRHGRLCSPYGQDTADMIAERFGPCTCLD